MLLVKTRIGPSHIHGTGLFADEPIPAGSAVWIFHSDIDQRYTVGRFDSLHPRAREAIQHYGYREDGIWYLCGDDARFLNHAKTPNLVVAQSPDLVVAARDIARGEELTEDYSTYAEDYSPTDY